MLNDAIHGIYSRYGLFLSELNQAQKFELVSLIAHLCRHPGDFDNAAPTPSLPLDLFNAIAALDFRGLIRVLKVTMIAIDESEEFGDLPRLTIAPETPHPIAA
jgi:hypothetical protein